MAAAPLEHEHRLQSGSFKECSKVFFQLHTEFHWAYGRISGFPTINQNAYVFWAATISDIEVSGLVVEAVWTWDKLSVSVITWEPSLKIVFLGSGVVQSSWNDANNLVRQFQTLVELLSNLDHFVMCCPWIFWLANYELLNLFELMNSEDTPVILSVGTCLLSEARAEASIFVW